MGQPVVTVVSQRVGVGWRVLAGDFPTTVAPGYVNFTASVDTGGNAVLRWTQPLDGGSAITGYSVVVDGGAATSVGNVLSYSITGLSAAAHTIGVFATNTKGDGPSSEKNVTVATPPPMSAWGDGVNRTANIQGLIDGTPDGVSGSPSIIDLAGVSIRSDQTINISGRNYLTIQNGGIYTDDPTGDSSTLAAPSTAARTRYHWSVYDSTHITFDGVSVRGPNTNGGLSDNAYVAALEAQHCFTLGGSSAGSCNNITIKGTVTGTLGPNATYTCAASYYFGDAVYIGGGCDTILVDGIHAHHSGRQGISPCGGVTETTNVEIRNFYLHDMRRSCFDLEPENPDWAISAVNIHDGVIGTHRLNFVSGQGAGIASNVTIENVNLVGSPANVSVGNPQRHTNWVFTNVTSDTATGGGFPAGVIDLTNIDGVTVTGCAIPCQTGRTPAMAAFALIGCTGITDGGGNTFTGGSELFRRIPGNVPNFAAAPGGAGEIVLTWTAAVDSGEPIANYGIDWKLGTDANYGTVVNAGNVTTYTVTGLSAGMSYDLRIFAQNADESGYHTSVTGVAG